MQTLWIQQLEFTHKPLSSPDTSTRYRINAKAADTDLLQTAACVSSLGGKGTEIRTSSFKLLQICPTFTLYRKSLKNGFHIIFLIIFLSGEG